MFGLGKKTGVPLSNERGGLIPTSEWKLKRFDVPWQEGETLSVAVGQSYDLVTPLQNALLAAQIANGGQRLYAHLVEAVLDADGQELYRWTEPEEDQQEMIDVSKEVLDRVRKAMVGVVAEPGGTAQRLRKHNISMGGKTGTAQVVALDGDAVCKDDRCKDHAWFIGFAPAENPQVAAAVVVEHGGFGASAAAPIVGAMLEKYFEVNRK
jgi:penicillin-binding protein 2